MLDKLAKLCAILAGLLLTFITLMTCVSLLGRNTTGWTIAGDFELTGVATGAAVALFMPWCQLRRGHILVDFFTARLAARANERLDRVGSLLMAALFALLAWRTALGTLNAHATQSSTMMMGFPEWLVYAAMLPPFALSAAIALWQALRGLSAADEGTA